MVSCARKFGIPATAVVLGATYFQRLLVRLEAQPCDPVNPTLLLGYSAVCVHDWRQWHIPRAPPLPTLLTNPPLNTHRRAVTPPCSSSR